MFINKLILCKWFILAGILILSALFSKDAVAKDHVIGEQIVCDYHQFYSARSLSWRFMGLGLSGILANTDLDPHFRDDWQAHIRSNLTNNISRPINHFSQFANYPYALPFYFITMWLSSSSSSFAALSGPGLWANHCFRTIIVGSPEQFALSHLLGGGRPATGHPQWDLFKYHRAVSGHAFYGAIPLINLAKQNNDPVLKVGGYLLSVLPGLARINDDKHYLSQVALGWWLAYNAANAVWESDKVSKKPQNKTLFLSPLNNGIYLGLKANF